MPTIQIRNVSAEAHRVLRRRAAEAHQSLQEYLRGEVERMAARPTLDEALDAARRNIESDPTATTATMDEIVALIHDGRGE